jgi:tetratricopeptide (TPR) repeat protein
MVVQHQTSAKAHAIYGDYLFGAGQFQLARQEYEQTLSLDKSVFAVWEQLLYLKLAQHDMDGVLRSAEQALDVFPNQASIYYIKGVALTSKQDYHEASANLQRALIMSGRNAELRFQILVLLGTVYQETGELSKSYDAFNKAIAIKPDEPQVLNKYAYLLAMNNTSLDKAKEMAVEALRMAPNDADIEHSLAWIAFQQNDLKTAREFIEKAMDHGAGDRYKALEHYGDILFSAGEVDQAVEYWQLSQSSGNPSEVLKRKIAERRIIH